jgi:hypothetical protein
MKDFAFNIGDLVQISCSGETGVVIGRAEHQYAQNQYYIRYKAADGRATDQWWDESALVAVIEVV